MCIDKLDNIVNEYNNTYHRKIKMKLVDVKDNTYIDSSKEVNGKDPKFKVSDHVRISKYKNIFVKGYTSNWSKEVFVIKEVKNTVPWIYVINDLNGKKIIGTFDEKELQKTNQQEFRIEEVIKTKNDKLYVKWKGYDNPYGMRLLTRFPRGLSLLRDHKFRHCFQDSLNPLCDLGNDKDTSQVSTLVFKPS